MPLSLRLLGTFEIQRDGVLLHDFATQTTRALLVYLALESGRSHEREHLAALFWPDATVEQGLTNLRKTLHRLRMSLALSDDDHILLITRQSIGLGSNAIDGLDVRAFEAHLAAVRVHRHRYLWSCRSCLAHLHAASALYQGELLPGFSLADGAPFEEWLLLRREELHQQFIMMLDALAQHHVARRNDNDAATLLRRWLALEPWNEGTHARLIELLWRAGRRDVALRQFERCRSTLRSEIGVEPGPDLMALVERVRNGRAPLRQTHLSLPEETTTPLIGRSNELQTISERLSHPGCRLLTLVGSGGSGKTRLALQAAVEEAYAFADGAVVVPLATAEALDQAYLAIAAALRLNITARQDIIEQVCRALCSKELLLVLDNLEQLPQAAALVCALLEAAPRLGVLATSRVPLDLRAESLLPVNGLALQPTSEAPEAHSAAAELFLHVAHKVDPSFAPTSVDFETIAAICRHVEGVPLLIELAATQVRSMSTAMILNAISANFDLLATTMQDVPRRHRSMRAMLSWSWNLLQDMERILLARLSVFRGSFTTLAASAVAGTAALDGLCRHSLLRCDDQGRYYLHELIRQFAAEQLAYEDESVVNAIADRHSSYYLELAAQHEHALHSSEACSATALLVAKMANLRQAWQWAITRNHCDLIERSMRTMSRLYTRTSIPEGIAFFTNAVQQLRMAVVPPQVLGRLLVILSTFHGHHFQHEAAFMYAEEALGLAIGIGHAALEAQARLTLGKVLMRQGDYARATYAFNRVHACLHRADATLDMRTRELIAAHCLLNQGDVFYWQYRFEEAIASADRAQLLYRALGDLRYQGLALNRLGEYERRRGDYGRARHYHLQALAVIRAPGDPSVESRIMNDLGEANMHMGRYAEGRDYLEQARDLAQRIGDRVMESGANEGLGRAYLHLGEPERARAHAQQALDLALPGNLVNSGFLSTCLGYALEALGEYDAAEEAYRDALAHFAAQSTIRAAVEPFAGLARLALAQGDLQEAWTLGVQLFAALASDRLCDALEPLRVHLTCYKVLVAVGDVRADVALDRALMLLNDQAQAISDPELRRSFLEQVPYHRELRALAKGHELVVNN